MEEKINVHNGEELIDLDEEGHPASIKEEKNKNSSKSYERILTILLSISLLFLLIKIFFFNKGRKTFLKFKTNRDIYYNISENIVNYIRQKPNARIGLSYDESMKGLYDYLVDKYENGEISFKEVSFYSLDGICGLNKKNNYSYYYALNESFLSKIDVQEKNIFLINEGGHMLFDYENNAEEYDDILRENPIDLQILNVGEDGNIGFIDKNTDFDLYSSIIKLSPKKRRKMKDFFFSFENTPMYAITQGIKNILQSKEIILIAMGKNKAEGINNLMNGAFTTELPITALITYTGKLTIYSDEEAGSLIKESYKKF